MKNTIGNNVCVTLFGESHGKAIGAVIDGLAPGIEIDGELISLYMEKRKGISAVSTPRREKDEVQFLSGVFEGRTTGTPLCLIIENGDTSSKDYSRTRYLLRPGHADYTAECKYGGFQDYRGGGHFSGRITAPLVAAGAIALSALRKKGIYIATHILSCGEIRDREFEDVKKDSELLDSLDMPVLSEEKRSEILGCISKAGAEGDSVGGVLSTAVIGVPEGVGEPWFDTVEGMLSHALFSIPAVKGIEFGKGFEMAALTGSMANDPFIIENGKVVTATNNNGGINGGITNGMPITFRLAVKPTPSIYKSQATVDIEKMQAAELKIKGRHDPAIIHRAAAVVDCVTALVLCDLLCGKFGTDYLGK